MQLLRGILIFLLLGGLIAAVVIYKNEITDFSDAWQVKKEGEKAIQHHNWEKAVALYEKGVLQHPDNAELSITLGKLYQYQGTGESREKAETLFKSLINRSPHELSPRLAYAHLLMSDPARLNEAVLQCKDAMRQHHSNPKLMTTLGDVYKRAAENSCEYRPKVKHWLYDWAIYYYRNGLKTSPNKYQARFNLGIAYQQTDQLDKAAKEYCSAAILSPKRYEVHYNLGLVLSELKLVEEGYRHLSYAIELLREQDRMEEAQALAEQVQAFKNTLFQDGEFQGLAKQPIPESFLDKRCLIASPTAEQKN